MKRIVLSFLLVFVLAPAPARAFDTVKRHDVWSFKRGNASSVFDPVSQRWFVLEGFGSNGAIHMLDLTGPLVWQTVATQGTGPNSWGLDALVVHDTLRRRLLYFKPEDPKVYTLSLTDRRCINRWLRRREVQP